MQQHIIETMFTQWEFKDWQQSSASDKQAPETYRQTGLDLDKHGDGGVFVHVCIWRKAHRKRIDTDCHLSHSLKDKLKIKI